MLEVIFWISTGIILYIYILYPLVLHLLPSKEVMNPKIEDFPTVSLIIAAYNEEKAIEKKLKNTMTLDYPPQKMEIIVASDGSTDHTEEIVKKYINRGVRLINSGRRIGKTECQNISAKKANGDILIFSDANSIYREDTVKMLVRNFANPRVGCVGGRLRYTAKGTAAQGESIYTKYESYIKSLESKVCSPIGVDGGIYAIRKALFVPLEKDAVSDFIEPILIYKNGWEVIYDKEALITEEISGHMESSIARRVRIVTGALHSLKYIRDMLNPFRWRFFAFELVSHKVLRWIQPFFFIVIFISNIFLIDKPSFLVFLLLQLLLYICGILGLIFEKKTFFKLPAYFLGMNFALILSWINLIKRKNFIVWETSR